MSRPPIGTRWGDLSAEERATLPVGTRLSPPSSCPDAPYLVLTGEWCDDDGVWYSFIAKDRAIVAYPHALEPDPRDSAGPVDEGGGPEVSGDCDHDGDVPEVARDALRGVPLVLEGGYAYTQVQEVQTDLGLSLRYSGMVRLYWPANCDGGGDPPCDCLPEVDDGR